MDIKRYAATYAATLLAFGAIDAVWLTSFAAPLYKRTLGPLLLDTPRMTAAIIFYLVQIAGMMVFVAPRDTITPLTQTALFGALFGLFTYSTFDLTNLALLGPWTWYLAISDIAWGCFVSAAAAVVGAGVGRGVG
jgi:uncharacterized membrane protein